MMRRTVDLRKKLQRHTVWFGRTDISF